MAVRIKGVWYSSKKAYRRHLDTLRRQIRKGTPAEKKQAQQTLRTIRKEPTARGVVERPERFLTDAQGNIVMRMSGGFAEKAEPVLQSQAQEIAKRRQQYQRESFGRVSEGIYKYRYQHLEKPERVGPTRYKAFYESTLARDKAISKIPFGSKVRRKYGEFSLAAKTFVHKRFPKPSVVETKLAQQSRGKEFTRKVERFVPRGSLDVGKEIGLGYYQELYEKPGKTAATTTAFFLLPGILKGVGKVFGATAGRVIPSGVKTAASYAVGIGIPAWYGTSVYTRVKKAPSPGREFGRIAASELTPMVLGGYAGAKFWPKATGYLRTLGKKEIPAEKLVPPKTLAGKETYPKAPPRKHLQIFRKGEYYLPGRPKVYRQEVVGRTLFGKRKIKWREVPEEVFGRPHLTSKRMLKELRGRVKVIEEPLPEEIFGKGIKGLSIKEWKVMKPKPKGTLWVVRLKPGMGVEAKEATLVHELAHVKYPKLSEEAIQKMTGTFLKHPKKGFLTDEAWLKQIRAQKVLPFKVPKADPLGWHQTAEKLRLTVEKGFSEIPGLYVAHGVSPHFLRLGSTRPYGYKFDMMGFPVPTVAAITPKSFVGLKPLRVGGKYVWPPTAKPGVGYVPGIKTEVEAVLIPGTKLAKKGSEYYMKWAGVRVPIKEFGVSGEGAFKVTPTGGIRGRYYSIEAPAPSYITTPASYVLASYKPRAVSSAAKSYARSYARVFSSYSPYVAKSSVAISYRPSRYKKPSYVPSYVPSRVYKPSYAPSYKPPTYGPPSRPPPSRGPPERLPSYRDIDFRLPKSVRTSFLKEPKTLLRGRGRFAPSLVGIELFKKRGVVRPAPRITPAVGIRFVEPKKKKKKKDLLFGMPSFKGISIGV